MNFQKISANAIYVVIDSKVQTLNSFYKATTIITIPDRDAFENEGYSPVKELMARLTALPVLYLSFLKGILVNTIIYSIILFCYCFVTKIH